MALALNHNPPTIMHVDLNSCFATIEQQANPLFRGKPMVVAAYDTPNGCVVAPSIEAKYSKSAPYSNNTLRFRVLSSLCDKRAVI